MSDSSKACTKCGVVKGFDEFNPRRERASLQSWCKGCRAQHARMRRANMPKDELRLEQRRDNLKKKYGISILEFEEIEQSQGGLCAICKKPPNIMKSDTKYIYSTLRFVPDPARGEFINIGIIIGSDETKEWQIRTADNLRRARRIDDQGVMVNALSAINDIGRRLDRYTEAIHELFPPEYDISAKWLNQLFEQSQNVIQLSPPSPILASDIEDAISILFRELIVDPQTKERTYTTKHHILTNGRGKRLHVDHCHESGQTRGLLCHGCNTGLGAFRDSPELLARAVDYLSGVTV